MIAIKMYLNQLDLIQLKIKIKFRKKIRVKIEYLLIFGGINEWNLFYIFNTKLN